MNLRELCQMHELPIALLTTYNLDPLFFERVVITDLVEGGARRIIVLADAGQAYDAIDRVRNQIVDLGRRYRVIPIVAGKAFHPKICVRMGPQGAIVACGSHNLSRSGWLGRTPQDTGSGNREVSIAWRVEPGSAAAGDLKAVLENLSRLVETSSDRNTITDMLETGWLMDARQDAAQPSSWVLTGRDAPLSTILERRWAGRRFERLRFATGSTDDRATVIGWAAKVFGVKQAIVEVDVANCGFSPTFLKGLPVDLRICAMDGNPRSHLKIALFESGRDAAAVVGSANCSGAAWMRSAREDGNIESVVIYDRCRAADFSDLFHVKAQESQPWTSVPLSSSPRKPQNEDDVPLRQLKQMQLQRSEGRLVARLALHETNGPVVAVIGDQRVPLRHSPRDDLWVGGEVDLPEQIGTPFGWVEVGTAASPSNAVWIDDLDSLEHASDWRLPLRAIRGLSQHAASAEYRKLLRDLQVLSDAILTRTEDFPDAVRTEHRKAEDEREPPAKPLGPGALIRSLSELREAPAHSHTVADAVGCFTMSGVIRLLFSEARSDEVDDQPGLTAAEAQKSQEEADKETEQDSKEPPADDEEEPSDGEKRRFVRQLNEFADKLGGLDFAEKCTARQLQQAAAFPLAVARFASDGPWGIDLKKELAEAVVRTAEILLRRSVKIPTKSGIRELKPLLVEVRDRYKAEGRETDFNQIIGDGLLWLVLMGALGMIEQSPGRRFEHCLLLGDVAASGLLTATAIPDRLAPLAKRLSRAGNSLTSVTEIRQITDRLAALETYLRRLFAKYDMAKRVFEDRPGDWLWRPNVGFAQVISVQENRQRASVHMRSQAADLRVVQLDFYINLRQVMGRDAAVRSLAGELGIT